MFKSIDMATGYHQIRQAFKRLVRVIQTELEHKRVDNDSGVNLIKGDIVYNVTSGARSVAQAVNDSLAHADWVGVMSEPVVDGARGIARTQGYALVRYDTTASNPIGNEGMRVYVSDVAGTGTIDIPANPAFTSGLGILVDAMDYDDATFPFVYVYVGRCCDAIDNR